MITFFNNSISSDVVSARGDVQMISRAIEKEIEKYAQQNGELQKVTFTGYYIMLK